jgi:hypothetical protein
MGARKLQYFLIYDTAAELSSSQQTGNLAVVISPSGT